jgi:hypothetical protein
MTRWKAAGSHFALSLLVIGGIAVTAFLLWYPHGLYKVAGLDRILLVMLGIDLTAGPLLTLIVYKRNKPSLKFDLAVIALAQAAFLAYGLHTLWGGRPVFLVATPETYTVVFANEIADGDLAEGSRPEWQRLSWTGPVLVATRMPQDPVQRRAAMEEFMAGGPGIERTPKYYMPLEDVAADILEHAEPAPDARDTHRLMPIVSRRGEGWLLIHAPSALPDRVVTQDRDATR